MQSYSRNSTHFFPTSNLCYLLLSLNNHITHFKPALVQSSSFEHCQSWWLIHFCHGLLGEDLEYFWLNPCLRFWIQPGRSWSSSFSFACYFTLEADVILQTFCFSRKLKLDSSPKQIHLHTKEGKDHTSSHRESTATKRNHSQKDGMKLFNLGK